MLGQLILPYHLGKPNYEYVPDFNFSFLGAVVEADHQNFIISSLFRISTNDHCERTQSKSQRP